MRLDLKVNIESAIKLNIFYKKNVQKKFKKKMHVIVKYYFKLSVTNKNIIVNDDIFCRIFNFNSDA